MKRAMLCLFMSFLIFSCNSDDNNPQPQTQQDDSPGFYALKVGNSWVYKNYRYNTQNQQYEDVGVTDSISIIGTEELFGNKYFKFRRMTTGNEEGITFCNPNGEHFELLREFEGQLITSNGNVQFVNNNYEERVVLEQDWGTIYERLVEGENSLTVDAGTFTCINSERYAKLPDGVQADGLDRFYYAEGIGLIFDTSSFVSNSTHTIERHLVSYNVQ